MGKREPCTSQFNYQLSVVSCHSLPSTLYFPFFILHSSLIVQGLLLLWSGGYRGELVFRFQKDLGGLLSLLFIVYAAVLYPLRGYMLGHPYPHAPMFGVAPCPTT